MPLPPLQPWEPTAQQLHVAAQFLGTIRVVLLEHQSNYLEFSLKPVPQGLSTDRLPNGGEVILDFMQAALVYRPENGSITTVSLNGMTQADAFQTLLRPMRSADASAVLGGAADDHLVGAMLAALKAKGHHLLDEDALSPVFHINAQISSEYATALDTLFTAVARFHARLIGHVTPAVVWTEHFDLSMLWFVHGDLDDHKPHINFGFAPFSPGFPRPYLYAYAYPYPENMRNPDLPAPARWNLEPWKGVVVDYDDIARQADPAVFVEQLCLDIFAALRPLLAEG